MLVLLAMLLAVASGSAPYLDSRYIRNGVVMLRSGYTDQPYCATNPSSAITGGNQQLTQLSIDPTPHFRTNRAWYQARSGRVSSPCLSAGKALQASRWFPFSAQIVGALGVVPSLSNRAPDSPAAYPTRTPTLSSHPMWAPKVDCMRCIT